jgi:phosphoribosylglycinamide formyltransferase-1
MNSNKFAFYVSGGASRLIKVIDQFPEIIKATFLVINDEGTNEQLAMLLSERNIEYINVSYAALSLNGNEKNRYLSNLLLKKFTDLKIDYAFCFGGRLLQGDLLNKYKYKIINFHPSILPVFPGIKSIDQALSANAFLLGNTAHFIDEGIDTGPVIMQNVISSSLFSNYEDVLSMQLLMIRQIFVWINQNRIFIVNNKVQIKDAAYNQAAFFPKLEINN